MAKPLVIVESPAKAKTLGRFLGNQVPRRSELRPHPRSARVRGRGPQGDQGEGLGPAWRRRRERLHAVLRRAARQEEAGRAPQDGAQGRVRAAARHRPRSRRRVNQLAPRPGAQAEDSGPPHRLPRNHRGRGQGSARTSARDVNENLVRAQESRRILDRLYGYTLSPVLWKKVQTGLSAGRVQSVAVRLIVEREEERRAFRRGVYWDLEAT